MAKIKNWTVISQRVKERQDGLVTYSKYLLDEKHKNHSKNETRIVSLHGKISEFVKNAICETLDFDMSNKKGGRKVESYAQSFVLGMGQRLGLATALLGDPDILILDEPINGLDPDGIRWIRRLMRSHAAQGGTVLVSSHVLSELAEIADDIVIIADGTIRAGETLTGLIERYADLEQAYIQLTRGASASPGRPAPSATGAAR